jgi:hypothetical protein
VRVDTSGRVPGGRDFSTNMLPSPTKRIVLPSPKSLTANAAPSVLPTAHPILPHKTWLTRTLFSGKGTSKIPKLEVPVTKAVKTAPRAESLGNVPVSVTITSLGLKKAPTRGQNQVCDISSRSSFGMGLAYLGTWILLALLQYCTSRSVSLGSSCFMPIAGKEAYRTWVEFE